jgi:hypothetical protein
MYRPNLGEGRERNKNINSFHLMIVIFWEITPCGSYKNLLMIVIFWEITPCGSYVAVISQKMTVIKITAVETSNLTAFT